MGADPLRQFLQSLCRSSRWNYAVFWKLQHQSQSLLTWEDGYCDCPELRDSMDSIPDDKCPKNLDETYYSSSQSSIHDENPFEYPIVLAMAYMSNVQYAFGERFVGEVARTGNHFWLLTDNMSASEFNSTEFPDEWLFQFVAGIKTILLVPVVPHGVLQLGSLEMVAEDLMQVANIKDRFSAYRSNFGYSIPFTSGMEFLAQPSTLMSIFMENLIEPSAIIMGGIDFEESKARQPNIMNKTSCEESKAYVCTKPTNNKVSTTNQMIPRGLIQDAFHIYGKDTPVTHDGAGENDVSFHSVGFTKESKPVNQLSDAYGFERMETSMLKFSGLEEELGAFSFSKNHNVGMFGEYAHEVLNSFPNGGLMEHPFQDITVDNTAHEIVSNLFDFPTDCELHKALGPVLLGQTDDYLWDSSLSGEDAHNSSILIGSRNIIHGTQPSAWESSGWLAEGGEAANLLESVVANVCSNSDDNSSNGLNSGKSSVTSSGQVATSSKRQFHSESAFVARDRNASGNFSPSASSFQSVMSTLIDAEGQKKGYTNLQARKGSKLSNHGKRRARPGDNPRARPRDRQLIQDRVKELRELVPNGAKCSIDGLLDRTIKQMMFLRSVTDQADRLRQWAHQEVTHRKNLKASETMGSCQNGTSRAFELGSGLQVCPIVVEDLESPGEMLIEMLCDDPGLFLEIAEVICRVKLTILKGALEDLSNNKWARFVVKAPRGFHRLDIFWPLMQLLQQNPSPVSSKI